MRTWERGIVAIDSIVGRLLDDDDDDDVMVKIVPATTAARADAPAGTVPTDTLEPDSNAPVASDTNAPVEPDTNAPVDIDDELGCVCTMLPNSRVVTVENDIIILLFLLTNKNIMPNISYRRN